MGSQHPSPNVKNLCNFETQIWLEIITSRDAKSACFKGFQTSCTEIVPGVFCAKIWPKKTTSRDGCFLLKKNAIAIPVFSNRKFKIATLAAISAEKSRNEIANRCVSKSQIPNCNIYIYLYFIFACETAKTSRKCPNFQR